MCFFASKISVLEKNLLFPLPLIINHDKIIPESTLAQVEENFILQKACLALCVPLRNAPEEEKEYG